MSREAIHADEKQVASAVFCFQTYLYTSVEGIDSCGEDAGVAKAPWDEERLMKVSHERMDAGI